MPCVLPAAAPRVPDFLFRFRVRGGVAARRSDARAAAGGSEISTTFKSAHAGPGDRARARPPGAPGRRPGGGAPREQRRERRESQTNDMSSTSCDLCVPAHGWASGPPVRRRATGAAASATRPSKDSRSTYRQRALMTDIGTALTTDIPRSTAPPRPRRAPSTPQSEVI